MSYNKWSILAIQQYNIKFMINCNDVKLNSVSLSKIRNLQQLFRRITCRHTSLIYHFKLAKQFDEIKNTYSYLLIESCLTLLSEKENSPLPI